MTSHDHGHFYRPDPPVVEDVERLAEQYLARHEGTPYSENTVRIRRGHLHAFLLFLRGEYDPATDYRKVRL